MTDADTLEARALDRATHPHRVRAIADGVLAHVGEDSTGHDLDHAWRVFLLGSRIAETAGADPTVIQAAALTPDLHRSVGNVGDYVHPEEALEDVRHVLEAAGTPPETVEAVCHCVVHDEYEFRGVDRPAETLEAEGHRDADNLDATGAVGVARDFAFTGVVGNPLWDPTGEEHSGLGHFEDKLLRLVDEMHTDAARELAEERHAVLERFKARFEREWFGEA